MFHFVQRVEKQEPCQSIDEAQALAGETSTDVINLATTTTQWARYTTMKASEFDNCRNASHL